MLPGKMNSREMRRMMQQMGIKSTEMTDVKRIVMEAGPKKYIIENPQVISIEAQGQKSFQITGNIKEVQSASPKAEEEKKEEFPESDIRLVMEQTGCTREKAIESLKASEGEPADAIMHIISQSQ
ncbi:MAG: nascent polypeptide-associated complex protein [Candidatus Thermoplasmatota archaeon]|jgi:nascent polypeptide-associated complex subunit alpha|nr:nascent polypeptide-associated complex protein [Candidatus Thermoplasmatota archaeon]MCL5790997.1 nascent polypeptide-associated complex protein [Candidatus Thermoplasmatota archaeon]